MNRNLFAALQLEKLALFVDRHDHRAGGGLRHHRPPGAPGGREAQGDRHPQVDRRHRARRSRPCSSPSGMTIGVVGTLAGSLVGLAMIWVQNTYKIIRLAGDVYQIDHLPMKLTADRLPPDRRRHPRPVLLRHDHPRPPRRLARSRWMCCDMSRRGPMREPLLVGRGAEREYRTGPEVVRVLRGAPRSQVGAGEVVALVGASGVGKSTLLHLLGALDRPSAGRVLFQGEDLFARSEAGLARYRRAGGGLRLPVLQPAGRDDGARERDAAGAHRAAPARARRANARPPRWPRSGSATACITGRGSCRAASSSAWPSRGRS